MRVESYEVYDVDGQRLGQVVEARNGYLVVEHGMLFKSQRAVPRTLAAVNDEEQAVHLQVSREVLDDSPPLGADFDQELLDAYYAAAAALQLTASADETVSGEHKDAKKRADDRVGALS